MRRAGLAITAPAAAARLFTCRPARSAQAITSSGMAPAPETRKRNIHSTSKASSGGVTYAQQSKIPHLPIPTIAATADKFLDAARPWVSDARPGVPVAGEHHQTEDYKRLKAAVEDFKTSPFVQELQTRLQEHAKGKDSWLINWFNSANYFGASPYRVWA